MTPETIAPAPIRYIKLGAAGCWAKHFGHNDISHELSLLGDKGSIVAEHVAQGRKQRKTRDFAREPLDFSHLPAEAIRIIFEQDMFWPTQAASVIHWLAGPRTNHGKRLRKARDLAKRIFDLDFSSAILTPIAFCLYGISPSWAQTTSIKVPSDQHALTAVLSKYNELRLTAPNSIGRDKINAQFRRDFCAHIPQGDVKGWIGSVDSVDDRGPDKSLRLDLSVHTDDLFGGPLGVELSIENFYGYGVDESNTEPHAPTTIPVGSPLYDIVAKLRSGDIIRFNATFIPYFSAQVCYDNNYTTRFALVRFNSIQRLGYNIRLE